MVIKTRSNYKNDTTLKYFSSPFQKKRGLKMILTPQTTIVKFQPQTPIKQLKNHPSKNLGTFGKIRIYLDGVYNSQLQDSNSVEDITVNIHVDELTQSKMNMKCIKRRLEF